MSNALARGTDPRTSKAAIPDEVTLSYLRYRALQQFGEHRRGLIPDEVEAMTRIKGIWRRCSDLKNDGYVEVVMDADGPVTLPGRSGKCGEVLRITEAGVEALRVLEENPPKPRRSRKRSRGPEQRVMEIIEEWSVPAESSKGFGTTLTRAEKYPVLFTKAIMEAWRS